MTKRKTNKQFRDEVANVTNGEYVFLEEYINSQTKILCKHNIPQCGYEWKVYPNSILKGHGCPFCANEEKSKNKTLSHSSFLNRVSIPEKFTFLTKYKGMDKKIKVKCNICGHIWKPYAGNLTKGHGCPQCHHNKIGDIKRLTNKEFIQRVKKQVGDEYTFLESYQTSKIKLKVKHNKCGHIYKVTPNDFLNNGTRCPECYGNKRKTTDRFKEEVYNLVGNEYVVLGEYKNCKTKIKIKHNKCGNVWEITPSHFLGRRRCPECSSSRMENRVFEILNKKNINYTYQAKLKGCNSNQGNALLFDFKIETPETIMIECDGRQHYEPNDYFGGEKGYKKRKCHDLIKDNYCQQNNISLLRIPYWEKNNIKEILENKVLSKIS